ncbi:MAG TPA: LytTR family DNA-binding domain-containing protein [Chitinophagaceae bacterium]|nr:LytTR family DNA-binding domain-containing protein [Chitinophagaceae bacterium]
MKVVIVEDERLAAERLVTLLRESEPATEVMACLDSVEATVQYLRDKPYPDLLFLDIHLSDGPALEIFRQVSYDHPVIFTTAYDRYALDAFRVCSIDYILKPVTRAALEQALGKYRSLARALGRSAGAARPGLPADTAERTGTYKKRFLGKVGQRLFFLEAGQVACFQADNKIVYLVDREGNRYVVDHTLENLERQLDPTRFFRLNRRYIVQVDAIQQVRPYYNSRLKLSVKGIPACGDLVISRDRVAGFKAWAGG